MGDHCECNDSYQNDPMCPEHGMGSTPPDEEPPPRNPGEAIYREIDMAAGGRFGTREVEAFKALSDELRTITLAPAELNRILRRARDYAEAYAAEYIKFQSDLANRARAVASSLSKDMVEIARERDALREAGKLPRNTRWAPEKRFEGEWVVIPKEDFDAIRSLARKESKG